MDNLIEAIDATVNATAEKLLSEKRKAMAHQANLESKQEQLNILIEKLSKLSSERSVLIENNISLLKNNQNYDFIKANGKLLSKEIEQAREHSQLVEDSLLSMKSKTKKLSKFLLG